MKVKEALRGVATNLAIEAVEEAPLEAELLLMHVLGLDRAGLYVALEDDLSPECRVALSELVDRRLRREPLAYITGRREFFGLDFYVGPTVLIPRPETELLVEEAVAFAKNNFPAGDPVIADIGTGSGAIAVSLAVSLPRARVYAVDISARAMEIAQVNCLRHNVGVELLEGDILSPLPEAMDVIVANLPYVRDGEIDGLSDEIRVYEPRIALSGGEEMKSPRYVCGGLDGYLFVADPGTGLVYAFTPSLDHVLTIGRGEGIRPSAVAASWDFRLYVADLKTRSILVYRLDYPGK